MVPHRSSDLMTLIIASYSLLLDLTDLGSWHA
jgi:hypothetical protein